MFELGLREILIIGVALLLIIGVTKLPEIGKSLRKAMRVFKTDVQEKTDRRDDRDEANDKRSNP